MTTATITGYPRIGLNRELKRALEGYWSGKRTAVDLDSVAASVRRESWRHQRAAGIDLIPVNDFSLYDQMLDMMLVLGAIPPRFGWDGGAITHDLRFAMARGVPDNDEISALEMTKWFDTNYHYLVPELAPDQTFRLADDKPLRELAEAQQASYGELAKVVLIGPLTFLLLAKSTIDDHPPVELMDALLPTYEELVRRLVAAGAHTIQFDEPVLVMDRTDHDRAVLATAYQRLAAAAGDARLIVQTYFGDTGDNYDALMSLSVDGVGLDLIRGPAQTDRLLQDGLPNGKTVYAGIVDGRNVWINDLSASLGTLRGLADRLGPDRVVVSSSCSLLHVPIDVTDEDDLDPEIRSWLAFANQKLDEIALLARGLHDGDAAVADQVERNRATLAQARASIHRDRPEVRARADRLPAGSDHRGASYAERATAQRERLRLPEFPTTTIGSFPQTGTIRKQRRAFESGQLTAAAYERFLEDEIREVVRHQEEVGLDVLVHGEPERNDMVQYFGEQLVGFAFTHNGWVQSYGSRCVRPPIIYGDVFRPEPMTVRWATFAQSLTQRPVKGMLTGPVTILNWSFVRDDQSRAVTCTEIALAIQDEVRDLEATGIGVIQIDEPALREGLPLRQSEWAEYLGWATRAFRIASAVAAPETQIHTHMCYSEFGDIIDAIEALDADVLSIEHARSGQELLEIFRSHGYDKGIGPGVYDIHSPAVPSEHAIEQRLRDIGDVLPPEQIWVNPDCGLKTRRDDEVWPSLEHMVGAARAMRAAVPAGV